MISPIGDHLAVHNGTTDRHGLPYAAGESRPACRSRRTFRKRSAFVLPPLTRCCAENHDDHRWSWQRPFALQSQGHGAPDFLGEGPVRRRHALRFGDGPGSERVVVRFSGKQSGTDLDKVADGVDPL